MPEFNSRKDIAEWLTTRPREEMVLFAARAALRVVPVLALDQRKEASAALLLPSLRAMALSWLTGTWPRLNEEIRRTHSATYNDVAVAADDAAQAGIKGVATALAAAQVLLAVRFARDDDEGAAGHAANSIAHAARSTTDVVPGPPAVFLNTDAFDQWIDVKALSDRPLWPGTEMPEGLEALWERLKDRLPRDEDWDVWITWYEARLRGTPANMELEKARVLIPDADWQQGPAHVNRIIADLIDEYNASKIPQESPLEVNRGTADIEPAPPRRRQDIPEGVGQEALVRNACDGVRDVFEYLRTPRKWQEYAILERHFELVTRLLGEQSLRPERLYSTMDAMGRSTRRLMVPSREGGTPEVSDSDDTHSLLDALDHAQRDLRYLYPDLDAMLRAREPMQPAPPTSDAMLAIEETLSSVEELLSSRFKEDLQEDAQALLDNIEERGAEAIQLPLPEGEEKTRIYRLLGRLNQIVNLVRLPIDKVMEMVDKTAANIQRLEKWRKAADLVRKHWPIVRKFLEDMISSGDPPPMP